MYEEYPGGESLAHIRLLRTQERQTLRNMCCAQRPRGVHCPPTPHNTPHMRSVISWPLESIYTWRKSCESLRAIFFTGRRNEKEHRSDHRLWTFHSIVDFATRRDNFKLFISFVFLSCLFLKFSVQ
jgi:hypothetical protein